METTKVPVSMRALHQRINRKLLRHNELLRKTRGQQAISEMGTYFVMNYDTKHITRCHVDVASLGRELGVLGVWERVEEGENV